MSREIGRKSRLDKLFRNTKVNASRDLISNCDQLWEGGLQQLERWSWIFFIFIIIL